MIDPADTAQVPDEIGDYDLDDEVQSRLTIHFEHCEVCHETYEMFVGDGLPDFMLGALIRGGCPGAMLIDAEFDE